VALAGFTPDEVARTTEQNVLTLRWTCSGYSRKLPHGVGLVPRRTAAACRTSY